ncbi:dipeptide ABC transporter ATP-binding protein [Streptomyces spiralis]|uniref:dipeptide ABC transporter ATP-binding protein n=1 Tax=Streptomyces spiralis TaxID=66376 RepID=UPI0033E63D22
MTAVLEVRGLTVAVRGGRRGLVPVVRGVDLTLCRSEVLGLVGESGAGKTLTAMSLLGLVPPGGRLGGSVRLSGDELVGLPERELAPVRGRRIAMVFQDPLQAFTPVRRIGDQIAEAIRIHERPRPGRAPALRRAVELLDFVGVPDPARAARAYPHQLSGGMLQRAMIAMAVANRPDVLVADEPTSALDVTVRAQVLQALADARRETGAALLLVTHDLAVAAGEADRVAVMYAGRIVETGPVGAVLSRPRMPYTLGLVGSVPRPDARVVLTPVPGTAPPPDAVGPGCPFAPRCPLAQPRCAATEPELAGVDSLSGAGLAGADAHEVACHRTTVVRHLTAAELFPPSAVTPPGTAAALDGAPSAGVAPRDTASEVVLRVSGLARSYRLPRGRLRGGRSLPAVEQVDLEVRRGETLALVGESGAGKSTTLMEIASFAVPEAGRVEILGQDTALLSRDTARRLRGAVQLVPQDPFSSLDPRMPVGDIVAEPLLAARAPRAVVAARVPRLLAQVGLDPADAERHPHEFSGGQRQRIAIARALATEPALLLLDEPVSALDVSVQAGILDLLLRLKRDIGPACLLVTHDLAVVRQIADRVSVMYAGRTVETGTAAEVLGRPRHPYTRALLSAVPLLDTGAGPARRRIVLPGERLSGAPPGAGCRFRPRCPVWAALAPAQRPRCETGMPPQAPVTPSGTHTTACHFPHGDVAVHDSRTGTDTPSSPGPA